MLCQLSFFLQFLYRFIPIKSKSWKGLYMQMTPHSVPLLQTSRAWLWENWYLWSFKSHEFLLSSDLTEKQSTESFVTHSRRCWNLLKENAQYATMALRAISQHLGCLPLSDYKAAFSVCFSCCLDQKYPLKRIFPMH